MAAEGEFSTAPLGTEEPIGTGQPAQPGSGSGPAGTAAGQGGEGPTRSDTFSGGNQGQYAGSEYRPRPYASLGDPGFKANSMGDYDYRPRYHEPYKQADPYDPADPYGEDTRVIPDSYNRGGGGGGGGGFQEGPYNRGPPPPPPPPPPPAPGSDQLPKFDRNRNVHVHDLPERPDENIPGLIARISELLHIPIDRGDIQAVYRIRASPGRVRPLVIEFADEGLRNDILMAAKRIHLNTNMFYEDEEPKPVYINEPLTRFFRKLLYEAKRKASTLGYKFCWYRNSKLHVRKDEYSDPIDIETFEDLEKIV